MERLSLQNEFLEGENNAFLFQGEQTVLVDTGHNAPEVQDQLAQGLAAHDVSFADVDAVLLTHYHIDHCALAPAIQQAGGATIYAHPTDIPLAKGDPEAWGAVAERRTEKYDEWGMPADSRADLDEALIDESQVYDRNVEMTPVEAGDTIDVGTTELTVVDTPGHTAGHIAFERSDRNEILTGDALLPHYTPNVGGADVRPDNPLELYLESLQRIADGDYDVAWPGHREPIEDPTARAMTIIGHHEERARRVVAILENRGEATAWEVSSELFGELEGIHNMHGPGESWAHLAHLTQEGAVEQVGNRYRLTSDGTDRLDALSGDVWPLV